MSGATSRQPAHRPARRFTLHKLSAELPAQRAARLAAGIRITGERSRPVAQAGARPVRHQHRHPQPAAWRDRAVQRGHVGGAVWRGERLDRTRMARPRPAAARVDPGAGAESRPGSCRDRTARGRSPLRPGAAARDGDVPLGRRHLLADLPGRRTARPRDRHPRRQHLPACATAAGCRRISSRITSRKAPPSKTRSSASWPKACSANSPA